MKDISIFDKIEDIDEYIGEKGRKFDTVIEIFKTDNPDIKTLNLKNGSWDGRSLGLL